MPNSDVPRPVIVVTVYRRYYELVRTLREVRRLGPDELGEAPPVIVVWAAPEPGRVWLFRRLRAAGLVHHVVYRARTADDGPGKPTTGPESLNLRYGLEEARRLYPSRYAVVLAGDACPRPGRTLRRMADGMAEPDARAVVLYWANASARENAFHTNCFAVALWDDRYWPPVSPPDHPDVLERQWGRRLAELALPGVSRDTNAEGYWFYHEHLSENRPPWPTLPWHCVGHGGVVDGLSPRVAALVDDGLWCRHQLSWCINPYPPRSMAHG